MARDLRLDSLRGLMLVEITFAHISSPASSLVHEFFGRVSVAAAFFFLSGLVAGSVYGRVAAKGWHAIITSATKRAFYIHGYHVCTFLFLLFVAACIPAANGYWHFSFEAPAVTLWDSVRNLVLLAYQPQFFDVLPLYTVFVLFMPVALYAIQRGHTPVVMALSLALWAVAQTGWGGNRAFGGSYFNPFAWQVLFFTGLYFGECQVRQGREIIKENKALVGLCLLICLLGFSMRWNIIEWPAAFDIGSVIASKSNYGVMYFVNFFAFAYLVSCLCRRFPWAFVWRPLAFLGQHSIQVFSFHIIIIYMTMPLQWHVKQYAWWWGEAFALAVIASLFLAAKFHQHWQSLKISSRLVKRLSAT